MQKKFLGDGDSIVVASHYRTKVGHDASVDERGIYTSTALAIWHVLYINRTMRIASTEVVIGCVNGATSDSECCILMRLKASFSPF